MQVASTKPPVTASHARIQDLVAAVGGPDERLDPEVEALLLDLADDFVEQAANLASTLAKHRNSHTLDVMDLQMGLEKQWQMRIPGFSTPEAMLSAPSLGVGGGPSSTLSSSTGLHVRNILAPSYGIGEAHRRRLALIAKAKSKEAKRAAAQGAQQPQGATAGHAAAATDDSAKLAAAALKKRKRDP